MNGTGNTSKNLILAIVGVAVVLGILIFYSGNKQPGPATTANPATDLTRKSDKPRVVHADVKGILMTFPADFPVEAGAETTTGYKYVPANSLQQQSTLEYVSKKSLAENGKIFTSYFRKAAFKISNKVEQPSLLIYYGTKDQSVLTVKIQGLSGKVMVSASYVAK